MKSKLRLCCGLQRHLHASRTLIQSFSGLQSQPLLCIILNSHSISRFQLSVFGTPRASPATLELARCTAGPCPLWTIARGKRKRGEKVGSFAPFSSQKTRVKKVWGNFRGAALPPLLLPAAARRPPPPCPSPGPSPRFGDTHARVMRVTFVTQAGGCVPFSSPLHQKCGAPAPHTPRTDCTLPRTQSHVGGSVGACVRLRPGLVKNKTEICHVWPPVCLWCACCASCSLCCNTRHPHGVPRIQESGEYPFALAWF